MRAGSAVLILFLVLIAISQTATVESWFYPVDGTPVAQGLGDQVLAAIAVSGDEQTYVAWTVGGGLRLTRLESGAPPTWPSGGLLLDTGSSTSTYATLSPAADGSVIAVWRENDGVAFSVYAQRIAADGTLLWGPGGVPVTSVPVAQALTFVANPDDSGGVDIAWRIYLNPTHALFAQRVDRDGVVRWDPSGVPVYEGTYPAYRIASDGEGGLFVCWHAGSTPVYLRAQHLDAWGSPLWEPEGRNLGVTTTSQWELLRQGPGFQVLRSHAEPDTTRLELVQMDDLGAPVWAVTVTEDTGPTATLPGQLRIADDAFGGTIVATRLGPSDSTRAFAQRIAADGTLLWDPEGVTVREGPATPGSAVAMAADRLGGAWFTWWDSLSTASSYDIYAQWIDSSGAAQWPPEGETVCAAVGRQEQPRLVAYPGPPSATIAWRDRRFGDMDVYVAWNQGAPDPPACIVPPVLFSPDGGLAYVVHVEGLAGPLAGAHVELAFTSEADALVCWCGIQDHPLIEAWTDSLGNAEFRILAGGCLDPAGFAAPPVSVYADGVLIGQTGTVSPDYNASCDAGLPDAVQFLADCQAGTYSWCSDLDGDGRVGVRDAAMMQGPLAVNAICSDTTHSLWFGYDLPGDNSEASIALALGPVPDDCSYDSCITNRSLVTEGEIGQGYYVYVVVCDASGAAGVRGAECGIQYGADLFVENQGIGECFATCRKSPGLPSGTGLSFVANYPDDCSDLVNDPHDPDPLNRVVGQFYVYAYGETELELIPHPDLGEVRLMECGGVERDLPAQGAGRLGKVGFGRAGFNPSRMEDDRPWCADDTTGLVEDTVATVHVLGNDTYRCRRNLAILSASPSDSGGTVFVYASSLAYTPPHDYNGPDRFTYVAGNPWGGVDSASVWVTVEPANDPPTAVDDSTSTPMGEPVEIAVLANDGDVDGDALQVSDVDTSLTVGLVEILPRALSVRYTPPPAFRGEDGFLYVAADGHGGLDTAAVAVTVLPGEVSTTCDVMSEDLWTFGQSYAGTSCSWFANYATGAARTPDRGIRTWIGNGGQDGRDFGASWARKDVQHLTGAPPDSICVWFRVEAMTNAYLTAYGHMVVRALGNGDVVLGAQTYCVAVADDIGGYEHQPGWLYLESRPATYEAGAPWYERQPDEELRPPVGWWYKLTTRPGDDLGVVWADVRKLRIELTGGGSYLYGDAVGIQWDDLCIHQGTALGIGDGGEPVALRLGLNVPNPFRSTTLIPVDLPADSPLEIVVFDVAGRLVRALVSATVPAGRHRFLWNGDDDSGRRLAPGIYLIRMRTEKEVATRKAILMP